MGDRVSDLERRGIKDLLDTQSPELAISLARVISKNILQPRNVAEAVDAIVLHSSSVHSILSRKLITKGIIFKYLNDKQVSVTSEFSKQLLIDKTIEFWETNFREASQPKQTVSIEEREEFTEVEMLDCAAVRVHEPNPPQTDGVDCPEHFPINQMSRKFATWFYLNLNGGSLQSNDFWGESECSAQFFSQNICAVEETHTGSERVTEFCLQLKNQYNLYFNLNESHSGTQGRIDRHGLVLVLSCGSLHKVNELVGTFESVFALSRDPYCSNNWKVNRINFRLHNFGGQISHVKPVLDQCESLVPLLRLETPNDAIE